MKAIVLENGFVRDIPKELINYLTDNQIEWEWYDMRERFWPENRQETFNFFLGLPVGQEFYCHTVFDGFQQLELMVELFEKLRDKQFKLHIMNASLPNEFDEFLDERESSITPKELEKILENEDATSEQVSEAYKLIEDYKIDMNNKFFNVLKNHDIFWIDEFSRKKVIFKSLEDIKANCH